VLKDLNLPKENTIHLISTIASTTNGAARSSTTTTTATKYLKKTETLRRSINCFLFFFCKSSRTHRHIVSPPKHASSVTSPYFPITVLYEDKPGKPTPYDLVLKSNATIADVRFVFDLIKDSKQNLFLIFR
jgi:hypothetical protein